MLGERPTGAGHVAAALQARVQLVEDGAADVEVGLVLVLALGIGLGFGLGLGLGLRLGFGPGFGLTFGLAIGLVVGLGTILGFGIAHSGADDASPLSPLASWQSDRAFGIIYFVAWLIFCLVAALVAALVGGLALGLPFRPSGAVELVLVFGFAFGLVGGVLYPKTWPASLAFAQLALRWRTPVRLMRFLEDARERNVLRTVGPFYQFRHARLQDRLARQTSMRYGTEMRLPVGITTKPPFRRSRVD